MWNDLIVPTVWYLTVTDNVVFENCPDSVVY